jgi:hypothetical protein
MSLDNSPSQSDARNETSDNRTQPISIIEVLDRMRRAEQGGTSGFQVSRSQSMTRPQSSIEQSTSQQDVSHALSDNEAKILDRNRIVASTIFVTFIIPFLLCGSTPTPTVSPFDYICFGIGCIIVGIFVWLLSKQLLWQPSYVSVQTKQTGQPQAAKKPPNNTLYR